MPEIIALPKQRFACVERQRVRQAIAEVQSGPVTGALSEVRVGLAGQAGVTLSHWFDYELGLRKQRVEASADDGIALRIQNYPALEITGSR